MKRTSTFALAKTPRGVTATFAAIFGILILVACGGGSGPAAVAVEEPADQTAEVLDEGVRMIPVETPKGTFNVWTKKVGDSPSMKLLLLHGGPGGTYEFFENFADFLPPEGIEIYFYDQLGSYHSDQPDDPDLWVTERFVEEVEQVRIALGLGPDNFYILGHSWGGILAMEYALKYGDNIKGLIISNMMASISLYNTYAEEVLMPQIDPDVLARIKAFEAAEDYANPMYMELLMEHHYVNHVLRAPAEEWPEAVMRGFEHLNSQVYVLMQGPSELGASGRLLEWDRTADLKNIEVPTLVVGAQYDTMDPAHMEWMSEEIPNGQYLFCPNGSHCASYDDEATYMPGVIRFIKEVDGATP